MKRTTTRSSYNLILHAFGLNKCSKRRFDCYCACYIVTRHYANTGTPAQRTHTTILKSSIDDDEDSVVTATDLATASGAENVRQNVKFSDAKPFSSIPGPRRWPIFGNLLDYKLGSFSSQTYHLALADRCKKYGPLVKENFGGRKVVHIFDPQDAQVVYQNEGKIPYVVPLQETALLYRSMRQMTLGLGNMNGEEWYKLKKNVQQAMLRPHSVFAYIPMVESVANDFMAYLRKKRDNNCRISDLKECVAKWSLESSGMLVFEKRLGAFDDTSYVEEMIRSNKVMFNLSGKLKFSLPIFKYVSTPKWRQLVAAEDYFYDEVNKLIKETFERMQKTSSSSLVEENKFNFMAYLLSKPELSQKDAYIICLSLFGDGLNTTAPALIYNMYCLASNSEVQEKLYEEIKSTVTSKNMNLSADLLQNMPYLKACVKECFRLYPIGTEISRIAQKDLVLSGYQIPSGTHIEINMGPQLKSDVYFTQPKKFVPDRWIRQSKREAQRTRFILTPFGHGPRMCAGRRFAEQDLYVALIKLVQNFEIRHEGPPVEQEMHTLLLPTNTEKFSLLNRKIER